LTQASAAVVEGVVWAALTFGVPSGSGCGRDRVVTIGLPLRTCARRDRRDIDSFDRLVEFVEACPDTVYLRYSHGPDADSDGAPSRDYESGVQLPGLSVTTLTPES
jgi:hypothetical protein